MDSIQKMYKYCPRCEIVLGPGMKEQFGVRVLAVSDILLSPSTTFYDLEGNKVTKEMSVLSKEGPPPLPESAVGKDHEADSKQGFWGQRIENALATIGGFIGLVIGGAITLVNSGGEQGFMSMGGLVGCVVGWGVGWTLGGIWRSSKGD